MNNPYTIIDVDNWKRKLHCGIFKDALQPQYNVCLELDITTLSGKSEKSNPMFDWGKYYEKDGRTSYILSLTSRSI
ncbi:Chloramphenicol acetyltransferase [compost metagenome]